MNSSYGYDQYGNNTTITYPSGLIIQNVFDQYGNLTEIRKSDGTLIWQLNSITATGRPAEVTLGPGTFTRSFEYDTYENLSSIVSGEWRQSFNFDGASGNLMSRSYKNGNSTFMRTENFLYDTRERLTTSQVTGQSEKVVTYDQTGNILTKTDAGTYNYNSNKVNALASVTFARSAISTDLQTISYNSQNKATAISEDVNSYNIVYGADGERIRSRLYANSVLTKTKYYAPGYEKITTTGGTVENHYISSPYGLEAIIVKAGTSETMYLAETDHLGSLIGLKNTAGVYVERYSYDPWGRRRNPTDWSFNNVPAPTITDRGFTGHEHLDIFRLINMNGRLYDPVTGRFLNADPVIDNKSAAQGLNSYTYCLNNPLKYTEPTGYIFRRPQEFEWVDLSEVYYNALRISGYSSTWFDYQFVSGSGGGPDKIEGIFYDENTDSYEKADGTPLAGEELLDYLYSLFEDSSVGDEAANGGVYYLEGSYSYDKTNIQYLLAEGIGLLGGWSNVRGNANVYQGSDGKYYANVSATGFTPASRNGSVTFSGSVDVLVGNKVVSSYSLYPFAGPSIIQSGRQDVGSAVFGLPNASNDVYLRFNVGYSYSEGAGYVVPIPGQGHYSMQVGFTIDAWTY